MPEAWNRLAGAGITSAEGFNGKAMEHFKLANLMHVINAAGLCSFGVCSFEDRFIIPEFFENIIGWRVSSEDLFQLGDRIGTIRLAFNIREGITPSTWEVPDRVLGDPPLEAGPLQGVRLDAADELLAYQQAAGWDPESGKPTIEKLRGLGLTDLIADLWSVNGASE
jgi:aldehyde:ferredoxin oxidoreductase